MRRGEHAEEAGGKERIAGMPVNTMSGLKNSLDLGLGIVTRIWDYPTRDWVSSVIVDDINDDGQNEILACSRDGRVHLLSLSGESKWHRIIDDKAWDGTTFVDHFADEDVSSTRIFVGTHGGKVFMLDKDGCTVSREGISISYDNANGRAIDRQKESEVCWLDTAGHAIRQIAIDVQSSTILVASEDRYAYGLDYSTGAVRWKFQTDGWVRTISACDIDGDGQNEILVGSADGNLYLLDRQGQLLDTCPVYSPIYTIRATDVDRDGQLELLITTEDKDLMALVYHRLPGQTQGCFERKWRKVFDNRMLSFCTADVDGDQNIEIIAGSEDKHLYILDASGNTLWRHNHKFRIFAIFPFDIDKDGLPELLLGSENRRVRCARIRLSKGVEKKVRRYYRQSQEPLSEVVSGLNPDQRALLEDILRLNNRERVTLRQGQELMAAGVYTQALSTLLKLEQQKAERVWQKTNIGKIRSLCLKQNAGEQKREIIVGTAEGSIHAVQGSGRHLWSMQLSDQVVEVQTGFITHQRQEEIVACTADHHVYVLNGARKPVLRDIATGNARSSSVAITASGSLPLSANSRHNRAEIIIGSEDRKLAVYAGDLVSPTETLTIQDGVRIVRSRLSLEEHGPEIVVANLTNRVFAYNRRQAIGGITSEVEELWQYKTRDRIKAMCIKDINGDGKVEVLVGSEDRNIHVLDNNGKLLWRYYLPHSVLSIAVTDGESKIFVGCADGYLYVFNKEGDLLWTYETQDRIRALCAGDIDVDGNIEIAVGSEDSFELLRVVNQRQVSVLIAQCWAALQQHTTPRQVVENLLGSSDPYLRVFALNKLAELNDRRAEDFALLATFINESEPEVLKAFVCTLMILYPLNVAQARTWLLQLWSDGKVGVRDAMIEHIQLLMSHDQGLGFHYLKLATDVFDRFGRRLVVRKLQQLIDTSVENPPDKPDEIFRLLLNAARDKGSDWVCQEAARTLAYFLNRHYGNLVIYMHRFIVTGLRLRMLKQIAYAVTVPVVKHFLHAVIAMLDGLDEANADERLLQAVQSLVATSNLIYGKDLLQVYTELRRVFLFEALADIAGYQCELKKGQLDPRNKFAAIIVDVFDHLNMVSRPLKIYGRRENVYDRLASLLEASEAINKLSTYIEDKYATSLNGDPISRLPDHQVFVLLLAKWRRMVGAELNVLRGKAELTLDFQPKEARKDGQISIWLTVKNTGRSSASDVKVTFLHSDLFEIVGNSMFEYESILPEEEMTLEVTLRPLCATLPLKFEVIFNDINDQMNVEDYEDTLKLREAYQEFRYIPNHYSSGVPMHDSRMFYGREKEMIFLRDNLTRDARSVVVLYGQRRSGKTTVLLELIKSSMPGGCIPVFIDLQGISVDLTIPKFLFAMARAIAEAMQQKNIAISFPLEEHFMFNPTHTFNQFLNEVEKHLAGRKLILLIDEFEVLEEQIGKKKLPSEVFEYLRDIVQHRQSFNFLFAGTHQITEHTKWYRSVFFNIAIHYPLSRLSEEGAEALIQNPVADFLEYEPQAVQKIHNLTGDQPYLIHLMCRAIVDYCNDREKTFVTINDVNTVLREVMRTGRYHFDWLWDQFKPEVRVALTAISEGGKEDGRWLSFSEIGEIYRRYHAPFKREYMREVLTTLLEADIIEKIPGDVRKDTLESNRFRIPVGLTRTWLLKEHPVELTLLELAD